MFDIMYSKRSPASMEGMDDPLRMIKIGGSMGVRGALGVCGFKGLGSTGALAYSRGCPRSREGVNHEPPYRCFSLTSIEPIPHQQPSPAG